MFNLEHGMFYILYLCFLNVEFLIIGQIKEMQTLTNNFYFCALRRIATLMSKTNLVADTSVITR